MLIFTWIVLCNRFYMSAGIVNVPIVFRGPNGAAAGVAAQHSQCFGAWYSHCPGLKVYILMYSLITQVSIPWLLIGCCTLLSRRCQRIVEICHSGSRSRRLSWKRNHVRNCFRRFGWSHDEGFPRTDRQSENWTSRLFFLLFIFLESAAKNLVLKFR